MYFCIIVIFLKFSTLSSLDYLSETASFRCNMKQSLKSVCVAITDTGVYGVIVIVGKGLGTLVQILD